MYIILYKIASTIDIRFYESIDTIILGLFITVLIVLYVPCVLLYNQGICRISYFSNYVKKLFANFFKGCAFRIA